MIDHIVMKKIGYVQAFKAITVGLSVAYLIMACLAGPFWLFENGYSLNIIFGAIVTYISGYFFGGLVGIWILEKEFPAILFGIIGGFLIIWSATFIGSLMGYLEEGLAHQNGLSNSFQDYVYKPVELVTIFGFLPIIFVGIWYGLSIKKIGKKI